MVVLLPALLGAGVIWAMTGEPRTQTGAGGDGLPPEGWSGPGGVTWTGSVVVDSGGGHVGPCRTNRPDWRYVEDPTVALNDAARASVAWADRVGRPSSSSGSRTGFSPRVAVATLALHLIYGVTLGGLVDRR